MKALVNIARSPSGSIKITVVAIDGNAVTQHLPSDGWGALDREDAKALERAVLATAAGPGSTYHLYERITNDLFMRREVLGGGVR